ncbi:hypothetical protein B0H19DRAFT_1376696 [Mycena capillaripes]|nr:hypothetical protein B0H19DRAFT_1376696 [Mycena capillaripes]
MAAQERDPDTLWNELRKQSHDLGLELGFVDQDDFAKGVATRLTQGTTQIASFGSNGGNGGNGHGIGWGGRVREGPRLFFGTPIILLWLETRRETRRAQVLAIRSHVPRGVSDQLCYVIDPVGSYIPVSLRYCHDYSRNEAEQLSFNDLAIPAAPFQTANTHSTFEKRSTPAAPYQAGELQTTETVICISHVSGGTGGPGGRGGREGGVGGHGHGPSFQAKTIVIQNHLPERERIIRHQSGTSEWLLQHNLFKEWKAGEIQALYCRGIRKAGKAVASIVVEDLRANVANETMLVAALDLDRKETEAQSSTNLLAATWAQISGENPTSSEVHEQYKKRHTRPCLEEIYRVLQSAVGHSCAFIVVAGLDDYPEDDRDTLLRHLSELGPAVKLMFTSRTHLNIDRIILGIKTLDVPGDEEDHLKSTGLLEPTDNSSTSRESTDRRILKRCDGIFLLAKL